MEKLFCLSFWFLFFCRIWSGLWKCAYWRMDKKTHAPYPALIPDKGACSFPNHLAERRKRWRQKGKTRAETLIDLPAFPRSRLNLGLCRSSDLLPALGAFPFPFLLGKQWLEYGPGRSWSLQQRDCLGFSPGSLLIPRRGHAPGTKLFANITFFLVEMFGKGVKNLSWRCREECFFAFVVDRAFAFRRLSVILAI